MAMETIFLSIIVVGAMMIGLSIGVIVSNRRVKGSCAGIRAIMGDAANGCEICEMKEQCEIKSNAEECHDHHDDNSKEC